MYGGNSCKYPPACVGLIDRSRVDSCIFSLGLDRTPPPPPRVGYSQKNWMRVCGPLPKTLTLFMPKICDIPYPIYDLTKNLKPYLWPESQIKTLFLSSVIISSLVQTNVKLTVNIICEGLLLIFFLIMMKKWLLLKKCNQSINQSINFNLNSHKHYFYSVEKEK